MVQHSIKLMTSDRATVTDSFFGNISECHLFSAFEYAHV